MTNKVGELERGLLHLHDNTNQTKNKRDILVKNSQTLLDESAELEESCKRKDEEINEIKVKFSS